MGVQRLKPATGGATIKSIQRGTITLDGVSNQTSATATITAVDTAKSELRFLGQRHSVYNWSTADPQRYLATVVLTNSTTVTAAITSGGNHHTVAYEVTEWQQG